jgi:RNA polymerase-binding transcription factor DksA
MFGTLRSVPDQTLLSTLRDQLQSEREQLRARIAVLLPDAGDLIYDENFADSGQVAAEQGENKALLNQMSDQLREIENALGKFESGTYGVCERCGQAIAEPRLEAMPATRYCIQHA